MSTDVTLSAPSAADASEFIAAAGASTTLQRPWVSAPDTPERFAAFLIRAAREDQASYLIRHRDCGGLVGYVNINNIVRGAFRSGLLGYAAFASHAGRGLMSAGLAAVVSGGLFMFLGYKFAERMPYLMHEFLPHIKQGMMIGLAVLLAALVVYVLWKRRQRRIALLPGFAVEPPHAEISPTK